MHEWMKGIVKWKATKQWLGLTWNESSFSVNEEHNAGFLLRKQIALNCEKSFQLWKQGGWSWREGETQSETEKYDCFFISECIIFPKR